MGCSRDTPRPWSGWYEMGCGGLGRWGWRRGRWDQRHCLDKGSGVYLWEVLLAKKCKASEGYLVGRRDQVGYLVYKFQDCREYQLRVRYLVLEFRDCKEY